MISLGIKTSGHDSAATLVCDGKIVAACSQERFDRIKHSRNFPLDAINFCLKQAHVDINKVDIIAIPFQYEKAIAMLIGKFTLKYFPKSLNASKTLLPYLLKKKKNGEKKLREYLGYKGKIIYLEHHDCHAASAYFPSNFDSAAILAIDARGEYASTKLYRGIGRKLYNIETLSSYPDSLGYFYSSITSYLGFEKNSGEGKMMGLAPYGNWEFFKRYSNIIKLLPNGRFKLDMSFFSFHLGADLDVSDKFISLFGPRRLPKSEILQSHKNVAAFGQYVLEKCLSHICSYALKDLKEKNLCLAGGTALNSISNGIILKELKPNLFIQPAAADDGSALGAALLTYYLEQDRQKKFYKNIVYLGPEFSRKKILAVLNKYKLKYVREKNIEKTTAGLIAKGKIIGWFQGRAEFGPRSLGNRSILADPRKIFMKDKLNQKIKFRESFRPFAPSVMEECASKYFNLKGESPYMLITYKINRDYKKIIPAVMHIDGTARIQTVSKKQNLKFYELLKEFGKKTGIPILLNTSFNIKNEPIVNSPEDAVKSFLNSKIDFLVISNYLIKK